MSPAPRKRFGQHFLHDRQVIERIVEAIAPAPGDRLVEIGPGEGVLTERLLARTQRLDVIEIDRDLAAALRDRDDRPGRLHVHEGDVLRFDFRGLATDGPLRIAGNLPYNISTPLLFHLLAQHEVIRDMHFMLQREVVDRIVAAPGDGNYGRLSVMLQAHCAATSLFRVGSGAFRPPPAVDSAVVRLVPHERPLVPPELQAAFADIVRAAFSARRKTLRNGLRQLLSPERIAAAGVDPGARPQTLPVEAFVALAARQGS